MKLELTPNEFIYLYNLISGCVASEEPDEFGFRRLDPLANIHDKLSVTLLTSLEASEATFDEASERVKKWLNRSKQKVEALEQKNSSLRSAIPQGSWALEEESELPVIMRAREAFEKSQEEHKCCANSAPTPFKKVFPTRRR